MITFNNIVERFEIFAENHFFIKSFSFGSPDDVDLSKFEEFPLMHLVYTGATYDAGMKTYNLEVYILDVPHDKKGKVIPQKEAISDSEQCAEDILADIRMGGNIFLFAQDYEVVNATTTPLEEETKNVLSGVLLDLSVAIPYEWDACNAPIDGVAPGGGEVVYARRGVLRMLTLDGTTDVQSVRTIKVTNGTLTDDGDGVVTLDTGGVETLEALTDVTITNAANGQVIKYLNGIWINAADGGAISLNDLTDVIISQPAQGEFFRYDGGEWVNDTASKSDVGLGNVDNTSDANKPISTATQTALDAKPDNLRQLNDVTISGPATDQVLQYDGADWVNATFSAATSLEDLTDVDIADAPANGSLLEYNLNLGLWQDSGSNRLPTDGVYFHQRYETESEALRTGATATTELYFTCTAQGNGLAESASSDTPTAGQIIKRKIYYSEEGFADPDTGTWVEFTPAPADDASFATVKAALLENLKARTGGTVPISLKQTWEEVAAAPAFTGLLNETYGSGAAAAYSTRRLNGNVTECMVIRRASDSTTTTIGFDGSGNISEADIISFCTGTSCTVSEWKDQSGNGNDATQSDPTKQPTIYTGGVLVKENGVAAMSMDYHFLMTSAINTNTFSIFAVGRSSGDSYFMNKNGGNNQVRINNSGIYYLSVYPSNKFSDAGTTYTQQLAAYIGNSSTFRFFQNSTAIGTAAVHTINQDAIGGFTNQTQPTTMFYQELVVYTSDQYTAGNQTSIESNIGDYFTQNTPLLDTYSGAAAAYSLRLLDSSYVGSAIRVRRSSDNTEQDIGFNVFGELDTVSLLAFVGTAVTDNGYVKTWYDQSGNSNDATQSASTNNQPQIVSSGAVIVENGKPVINYNNPTTNVLNLGSALSSVQSVFQVLSSTRTVVYAPILGDSTAKDYHPGVSYQMLRSDQSASFVLNGDNRINGQTVDFTSLAGRKPTTQSLLTLIHTSASGNVSSLSNDRDISGRNWDGNLQEIILYTSSQSDYRANIETNINTFYNIY